MKNLLLTAIVAATVLAGCATTQSTQVAYVQACGTYTAGLSIAVKLMQDGKLTPAGIAQITTHDNQIYPVCAGQLPAYPTAPTKHITTAITPLTILETVKKVGS